MAPQRIRSGLSGYFSALEQRSAAIPRVLDRKITAIAAGWAIAFLIASLPRLLAPATPVNGFGDFLPIALPYLVVALAPIAGYRIASGSFPRGVLMAQPDIRLCFYGKWRRLNLLDARSSPLFGPAGFMASLLAGLLLNIVMRSFEFLLAVPALNHHAPGWGQALFHLMAADVAVMGFFYMVCFVMALRSVPCFPRMLLFVWALDIMAQLAIARQFGAMTELPLPVAASLRSLLEGNIDKVLISAAVWLPYLILSERVNVTFRQRVRA